MAEALSAFALKSLSQETQKQLVGARLEKAQQISAQAFKLSFKTTQGKKDLIIEIGKRLNITHYKYPAPQKPSSLAMLLRKHLAGKTLKTVKQQDFDRVITLQFEDKLLIIELFAHGNMVLTGLGKKVLFSFRHEEWRDRKIKRHEKYEYPKAGGISPINLTQEQLSKIFTGKDIIRSLVKNLKISPPYAEEACALAGVNKNKEKPTPKQAQSLLNAIKHLLNRKIEPVIQDSEPRPFPLSTGGKTQAYPSMSEAVDEHYKPQAPKQSEKLRKLLKRLEAQKKTLTDYEQEILENREKAEAIMRNHDTITDIINAYSKKQSLKAFKARKQKNKLLINLS